MGLKSGSRDAGLDDEESSEGAEPDADAAADDGSAAAERADAGGGTDAATESTDGAADRPTMESLPYKLRRTKVNEGRSQVPFFLREAVVDGEADLQDALEETLGEEVYKSDYREAAMIVAQRNPDLVAAVLREWGYDLDAA